MSPRAPGAERLPAFLADKSALTRRDTRPEVREALEPLLLAGEVATCGIVELELLYSATTGRPTVLSRRRCGGCRGWR